MNATTRGALIFGILVAFLIGCSIATFGFLPGSGISVGLPVIMVPGEPYDPSLPADSFRWTNTLTATVLGSIAVLAFTAIAWSVSKGWTQQVPGRFQSWVELLGGFMYNFSKQLAGKNARVIFPLVATIFVFLLAINWMKLLPGMESVGVMHCAEDGLSGYPAWQVSGGAFQLFVDQPLNAGVPATHETYEACNEFFHHGDLHDKPTDSEIAEAGNEIRDREIGIRELLTTQGASVETIDAEVANARLEITESLYHHPSYALSESQMRQGALPYIFIVTPFVRTGSTDLNLTIGLALVAVVAIQVFGVMSLGPDYFQKFINLRALGNAGKNPIGTIDFVVGIFEIISEIGKIISLAFRLFGNMFAGSILLAVMSFLIAFILPIVFIGLELIVTSIQALVFAVLTLVFAAQAMEGHHHGDEEHEHEGGPDSAAAEIHA